MPERCDAYPDALGGRRRALNLETPAATQV